MHHQSHKTHKSQPARAPRPAQSDLIPVAPGAMPLSRIALRRLIAEMID